MGKDKTDTNHVQLYLSLTSFPSKYANITIFYQLRCAATAANFSGIKSFREINEQVVWFRGVFPNEELTALKYKTLLS